MSITVLLADDHPTIRRGLIDILKDDDNFRVIGEASNGMETIWQLKSHLPDILVLDLRMPFLGGLEVLKQIKQVSPKTKTIVLSMYATEQYVLEAIRLGAEGFVVKDSVPSEIVKALTEVSEGRRYLSPPLSEYVIKAYVRKIEDTDLDSFSRLTPREKEVFGLVIEGLSTGEIAVKLSISPRTVEVHRLNLMKKLEVRNQSELLRFALRHGYLNVDSSDIKETD